jgi:sulfate transport system permease protein
MRARSLQAAAATTESPLTRWLLLGTALGFLAIFLFLPLVLVFVYAFGQGISAYLAAFAEPDARSAIRLTLITARHRRAANTAFGVVAAWAIAKFDVQRPRTC